MNKNITDLNVHAMSAHMTFSQKKAARNENCMTKPKNKKVVAILLNIVFVKITTHSITSSWLNYFIRKTINSYIIHI